MPSGDAQRTWFPEMTVRLRLEWHEGMSIPALIGLRDELDETLHRIRAGRNIQTPIITCRRCGTGHAAEPRVSVRALILALARFEIAAKDQTRALEKAWAQYRKHHRLDIEEPWSGPRIAARIEDRGKRFPPQNSRKRACEPMPPGTNDTTPLCLRFTLGLGQGCQACCVMSITSGFNL